MRGPKPGQIQKALAEKAYIELEVNHMAALEDKNTSVRDKIDILGKLLDAKTGCSKTPGGCTG